MKIHKYFRLTVLTLSLLLQLTALLLFHQNMGEYNLPEEWTIDFNVLLAISISLTFLIFFFRKNRDGLIIFFTIRTIAFFIIGIPFGKILDVEFLLLFALMIDLNTISSIPFNIVFSSIILAVSLFLQMPMSIYHVVRSGPYMINLVTYGVTGITVAFFTIAFKRLLDDTKRYDNQVEGMNGIISRLIGVNKGYLEYASKVEIESTRLERSRIVQELHDIVGKSFTNIYAMMDASLKQPPDDMSEQEEIYTWARDQAKQGLDETRVVLYRIREMKQPKLIGAKAIVQLVSTFMQATKVDVRISWGNLPGVLNPDIDVLIYNIIQESLVNAFRHGNATIIDIHFWLDEENLLLSIDDNGTMAHNKKKGIGQNAMEERAAQVEGSIKFRQTREGYKVHMSIPRERLKLDE